MARLVFDLDGTLVHSAPTVAAVANRLLGDLGRGPVPLDTIIAFVGNGVRRFVERLLQHTGGIPGDLDTHLGRFRALYDADPVAGTSLYPGTLDMLRAFAPVHGLAVCTQKSNVPALRILRDLGLMPPITGFTGGDSLDVLKPDPAMFHHAANQLPPGPAIFIGDSLTDAETARNAGVPFLLRIDGYRHHPVGQIPHAASFAHFDELPALVARFA